MRFKLLTPILNPLHQIYYYRYRLYRSTIAELSAQYASSYLGSLWYMIYPVLQMFIYCGLYVFIFRIRPSGLTELSYTLFVFTGLLPVLAFTQAIGTSSSLLSANKSLLLNNVFPAFLLPPRNVVVAFVPNMIGFLLTVGLSSLLVRPPDLQYLYIPIILFSFYLLATSIVYILSVFAIYIPDLSQLIPLLVMLLTMLSPFAFTPQMVPSALKPILYLNPTTYFILPFQKILILGEHIDPIGIVMIFIVTIVIFSLSYSFFKSNLRMVYDLL